MKTPAQSIALHLAAHAIKRERKGDNQRPTVRTHQDDTDIAGTINTSNNDAYDALQHAKPHPTHPKPRYLSLTTAGWASPNNDETAPSLHPERQRVALVCVFDLATGTTTSAIRFATKNKRAVLDDGTATGTLSEALHTAANKFRA